MSRPNILIVITHDSGRHFGCYGAPVATPNIDRIAASGVRFSQACCTAPQCSPARASLLTGLYPHRHGLIGLTHRGFRLDAGAPRLPALLTQAGYHTILFGVHHEEPDAHAMGYRRVIQAETRQAAHVTPRVVDYLASQPPQPFFCVVGFSETHRPYRHAPIEDPRTLALPPWLPADLPDHPEVREDLAHMGADIRAVDEAVGRIESALAQAGLTDTTLVIYTTDHGPPFPFAKALLTEAGLGTALVGRGPGFSTPASGGRVIDRLVSTMDLTPTLLELAGAPLPAGLDGRSLLPLLADPAGPWRDHLFAEQTYHAGYDPLRGLRSGRYRYCRGWEDRPICFLPNVDSSQTLELLKSRGLHKVPRPAETLYDIQADPTEGNNLAGDPAHEELLLEMRDRVEQWMRSTGDLLLAGPVAAPPGARFTPAGGRDPEDFQGPADWRE
ncbi:MAG: Arylsulfatase [Phycisphaerae bacterium]|nr:Arylsulfatase [Phycisphaerae bacterium]